MTLAIIEADVSVPLRDWTVGDLLSDAAQRAPDRTALKQVSWDGHDAVHWTYAELQADAFKLANFLLGHFKPGDHVAIWAANSAPWTLYQLAAAHAGLVLVTLNPALRGREVEALLKQSQAIGLIFDASHRGTDLTTIIGGMRADLPELRAVFRTDAWRDHVNEGADHKPVVSVNPGDPALLLYTSGTTGLPKGVVLSHRGIVNNAVLGLLRYEMSEPTVWLGVLPLFHVGGSVTSTLGCIAQLGTNIVVPAFDAGKVLDLIESERIGLFPLVPTMAIAIFDHEALATTDLSSLKVILTGGTIITPDFVRLCSEHFRAPVQVMFGQTEAGGGMCKTYLGDAIELITGTVGRPEPHTAMRIVDVQSGETCETDAIGEIRIRSPFMTRGYFDNPVATAAAFDDDGYLRTGDLGTLDETGYLKVTGRLKEMIIRGGENIYPREVEDRLGEFPGIVEAAVVGVPDKRLGEEVAVAIRCAAGESVETDAVRAFLIEHIARHKVPKYWKQVEDFPRTPSGKIQKFEVSSWFVTSA